MSVMKPIFTVSAACAADTAENAATTTQARARVCNFMNVSCDALWL